MLHLPLDFLPALIQTARGELPVGITEGIRLRLLSGAVCPKLPLKASPVSDHACPSAASFRMLHL